LAIKRRWIYLWKANQSFQAAIARVSGWQRSFIGLFAVTQILPDGFELTG